jgi:hypothetical protein
MTNDRVARMFARDQGVQVISLQALLRGLWMSGVHSKDEVRVLLERINPTTLLNEASREGAFSYARDRPGADAVACLPRTVTPHPPGRL